MTDRPLLKVGVLGASRIVPQALLQPAVGQVEVSALAARDVERARQFAQQWGIARSFGSYEELVRDPDLDIVYVALPAAAHVPWTLRALEEGKHVLCEKPFGLSVQQVRSACALAREQKKILREAQHSRFHPLRPAWEEALERIGAWSRVEIIFNGSIPAGDIRLDPRLGAGVMTDFGCYLLEWLLWLDGSNWTLRSAQALTGAPEVDLQMVSVFENCGRAPGVLAELSCDMREERLFFAQITVEGERGSAVFFNPLATHGSWVEVKLHGQSPQRSLGSGETTYLKQLVEFCELVERGAQPDEDALWMLQTQEWLDAVYRQAGLSVRADLVSPT